MAGGKEWVAASHSNGSNCGIDIIFSEACVYVSVFFRYTKVRSYAVKTIVCNVFMIILLTTYAVLGMTGVAGQTTAQVGDTIGWMMTVGCLLPYIAPLETIKTVVTTRSSASIPLGMCLAGAISNALWVLEGYLDDDIFMLVLSAACSFMGFVQVTLYIIYQPGRYPTPFDQPTTNCVLPMTAAMTAKSDTTVESLPSPNFIALCSP
ncbi:hypothetical protein DVH05_010145 [Phytophthora capsici]|nr:hypothetical protein DVH05_010145 [Phytophthora capsici]|eukprot:jgi/Phyca11/21667/fgenesh1_pg.PHYCAscaffold_106_\